MIRKVNLVIIEFFGYEQILLSGYGSGYTLYKFVKKIEIEK